MQTHYDQHAVQKMIAGLVRSIHESTPTGPMTVIGIRTRGETLADRIVKELKQLGHTQIDQGVLDITLYRDDLSEIGHRPMVRPTHIDTDINGKPLYLIDDVLFTGRTVRAALNALADFGRPKVIRLAVLVDRGGRELPIHADYVGLVQKDVPITHRVKVKFTERDGKDEIVIDERGAL